MNEKIEKKSNTISIIKHIVCGGLVVFVFTVVFYGGRIVGNVENNKELLTQKVDKNQYSEVMTRMDERYANIQENIRDLKTYQEKSATKSDVEQIRAKIEKDVETIIEVHKDTCGKVDELRVVVNDNLHNLDKRISAIEN